jgi:hypothetical protein
MKFRKECVVCCVLGLEVGQPQGNGQHAWSGRVGLCIHVGNKFRDRVSHGLPDATAALTAGHPSGQDLALVHSCTSRQVGDIVRLSRVAEPWIRSGIGDDDHCLSCAREDDEYSR